MTRELINELTWSVSRDRLFRQCRRAYYYNYYGSWGGWDAESDPRIRKLYILKNMQSLNMWAGSIVHETIAEALNRHAARQTPVELAYLLKSAQRKLRQGWLEAVNREWLKTPKKTNLFELYYGKNNGDLPREKTEEVRQRVSDCLESFADSRLLREIIRASYLNWKPVDNLDSFIIDDRTKVWCAIDFAYFDEAGNLRILDWKTGSEYSDELRLQLACYALFARQRWRINWDRLRLAGVFLNEQARVSEYPITEQQLTEAKSTILNSLEQMRSLLHDPAANRAREEDFPTCDDQRVCLRCNFREFCQEQQ